MKNAVKTKSPIAADPDRKTCQICGRLIKAKNGLIAHHGYTVQGGKFSGYAYFSGTCQAARYVPFEVSRDRLGEHIEGVKEAIELKKFKIENVKAEKNPIVVQWATRKNYQPVEQEPVRLTRENFEALVKSETADEIFKNYCARRYDTFHTFDHLKESELKDLRAELASLKGYLAEQQERFDAWVSQVIEA